MNAFAFARAWSKGLGFFSGAARSHALLLVVLGVLLPTALQLLLLGRPMAMMGSAARDGTVAPIAVFAAVAAGFLLQSGSYFASWRLGFGRGDTLGGALAFGLLEALMFGAGFGVALVGLALVFGLIAAPLAAVAVMIAFVGLFAILWTAFAAFLAVGVCLLFLLALVFGAASGDLTLAATMVGGSGYVWTILIAVSLVLLWIAGRLSCTTVLMAERRSFNLFGAMRDSWSLTWDDEWRIMRYLAVLGLAMVFAVGAAMTVAGVGLAASLGQGGETAGRIGAVVAFTFVSIPFAYLAVLVPAGIYRELSPADVAAAEVFA